MISKAVIILCVVVNVLSEDKDWVWEKNSRSRIRDNDDRKASPRYEIFEPDYDYDRPQPNRPRPIQGPGFGPGPGPNRPPYGRPPLNLVNGQLPPRPLVPSDLGAGLGTYYPNQDIDPGFNGLRPGNGRPPFKKFDTCSCTERFNCQSPGLSYGHCDVGKSYCCYNKHGGVDIGPSPSRPIQSPANGILVGPPNGGDFGYGHHGGRPGLDYERDRDFNRPGYRPGPGYGSRPGYGRPQGVLVGPGGPTGIIGRPGGPGSRPIHSAANGVLVGPGGPYDRPVGGYGGGPYNKPPPGIGLYGRSAQNDDDKNDNDDKKEKREA